MALPANRRTTSTAGSARLSLSVGKSAPSAASSGRHPLRHEPPGAKVEYEKEIRKVATFGSIESFLHLYTHLLPPNDLPPVTDILVFQARIGRPGVWEEMREYTLRLSHAVTPLLYESLLLSLIGDQFDEADGVVGMVLSVRQTEDILSLWVEEEGESVRSGALKEKIISLLSLPPGTICEYRSNKALLDAATNPKTYPNQNNHQHTHQHHNQHQHHQHQHQHREGEEGERQHGRYHHDRGDRGDRGERGDRQERGERGERGERYHREYREPRDRDQSAREDGDREGWIDRGDRGERGDRGDRPPRGAWGGRGRGENHGYHQRQPTDGEGRSGHWEGRNGWGGRRQPQNQGQGDQ